MVGGSGLYMEAVCEGIDELPDPDKVLRKQLNNLYHEKGITLLQQKLLKLDSDYYEEVDLNNPKRLIRAIEVCIQTGKTFTELRKRQVRERNFNILKIGLDLSREELTERINSRTDQMMKQGLLDEARGVFHLKEKNALNTVGYKELFDYLEGKWDMETAVEKIKTNTRRYAKRQMTWFRKDQFINWFSPNETENIMDFIKKKLNP
jgi:tRNA dimethylallyltransferase